MSRGAFYGGAGGQKNGGGDPHGPLMAEHLLIGAPVIMGVLMNIDDGLLVRGHRILQQRTGGNCSGGGTEEPAARKRGVHGVSVRQYMPLAMGKFMKGRT